MHTNKQKTFEYALSKHNIERVCSCVGVLLVSSFLRLGFGPVDRPLCKLLEMVCGARSGVPH